MKIQWRSVTKADAFAFVPPSFGEWHDGILLGVMYKPGAGAIAVVLVHDGVAIEVPASGGIRMAPSEETVP